MAEKTRYVEFTKLSEHYTTDDMHTLHKIGVSNLSWEDDYFSHYTFTATDKQFLQIIDAFKPVEVDDDGITIHDDYN